MLEDRGIVLGELENIKSCESFKLRNIEDPNFVGLYVSLLTSCKVPKMPDCHRVGIW